MSESGRTKTVDASADRVIQAIQTLSDQIAVGGSAFDQLHDKHTVLVAEVDRLKRLLDGNGDPGVRERLGDIEKLLLSNDVACMRNELNGLMADRERTRWWFQQVARAVIGVAVTGGLALLLTAVVFFANGGVDP